MRRFYALLSIVIVVLFTVPLTTPLSQGYSAQSFRSDINQGPYVDKLSFKIIADMGLRVLALQAGTIDMDLSFIDSSYLETLNTDPNIGVYEALRNGYGQITINCREYPLNISGLR